jgi:hypothetical protein
VLELLLFEIVVGKKNGIKREEGSRKEKGCPKVIFLDPPLYKYQFYFILFLDFLAHKKLHKNSPINNAVVQSKTLNLQKKSITQILMIKKNYNNIICL